MDILRFDGQTVVIINGGYRLGRAHALFFASRGANVVVNQYGGGSDDRRGISVVNNVADIVVDETTKSNGKAVSNYDSAIDGDQIIQTAIKNFKRIDVLINNFDFGCLDKSFLEIEESSWDSLIHASIAGMYKCTRSAWSHFKAQGYGRIINITSAAGLHESADVLKSIAGIAQVGFIETLAKEGLRYGILANIVAHSVPNDHHRIRPSSTIPGEQEEATVSLVAILAHKSNQKETSSVFETDRNHVSKLRWERARGTLLNPQHSLTPEAILNFWDGVNDFSVPSYPQGPADFKKLLEDAQSLERLQMPEYIRFDGKVILITGAGRGLGKAYALFFAKRGATLIVNDISNVDSTIQEIQKLGGSVIGNTASVEDGKAVIQAAIDTYGRIDILVNNAGFLRDKSFANMDETTWNSVINVHLNGAYRVTKAAWPYFLKQRYGKVINTSSTSGIYGHFGQVNYAVAKIALLGFSQALALEGAKSNIQVYAIAPVAGTPMGNSAAPGLLSPSFKAEYNAPMVGFLCSDFAPTGSSGALFEIGCGWQARTRWQRSQGHSFPLNATVLPEVILDSWSKIANFNDILSADSKILGDRPSKGVATIARQESKNTDPNQPDQQILSNINSRMNGVLKGTKFTYNEKDLLLYNLSIGARREDQHLVYEGSKNFQVIPTYGAIPWFPSSIFFDLSDIVPNFKFEKLVHADHYLEIRKFPIPTAGTLITFPKLIEVVDKGKATIVVSGYTTKVAETGEDVFYNEASAFVRGSGNFGSQSQPSRREPMTLVYPTPVRAPDTVVRQKTSEEQAAIYRLNGDMTSVHIDPNVSQKSGFKVPILHGLCSLGFSGQHILRTYGPFKSVKARFVGPVFSGQTLQTEMWREKDIVIFRTTVIESRKVCIEMAGARLVDGRKGVL